MVAKMDDEPVYTTAGMMARWTTKKGKTVIQYKSGKTVIIPKKVSQHAKKP
jgi:hypothetical protein